MATPARATPEVTDLTRPFWDAAAAGRLAIQRCRDCSFYNHPPRAACDVCLSTDLNFEDVSGLGAVWSFTVMHQKSVAGFEDAVPYLTALVELDEQPLLLLVTNLPGAGPQTLKIGDRVHVIFEPLNPLSLRGEGAGGEVTAALMLPQFVLQDAALPLSSQGEGAGGEVPP
jgi:uncharacterized OB-fold protein